MRLILSGILVCAFSTASATNYYFSAVSGDDSRSASQAKNPSTPWKSLNKLNSYFSSLQPGDSVLLKRGETFYGTITLTKSGTSSSPIIIGAYGSGARPVVTSLVTLSGWTANSTYSGVFESSANSSMGSQVGIVLLNDVQKGMGRYPNSTATNKGYLTLESHSGSTSIIDNELPASPNWTGAEVVIRTNRWTIDRSIITAHSGNKLTYSNSTGATARDGYGYFIQNDIKTLDILGEWYYNPSTKRISVFFGGGGPPSYTVKAATNNNLIYSSNISNVKIDNLALKGCNAEAVDVNGGSNIVVQNCDISYSGTDGVFASGSNFRIENCTVLNSNNDGIDVSKGSNAIVRNNTVKNSYTIIGMGQSGNGQGGGIRNCSKGLVEYNQVINTGYVGIEMGGDYSIIRNNLIDNFAYVKDDGGGIYTSNGQNKTNVGRVITGNIILNGIGAPDGTNAPKSSSADGIYFDDNTNGVEITNNTVANCNRGIYLHNSRSIKVSNNTFFSNNYGQLCMKHDALGDPLSSHTVTNNIFFSKLITQLTSSVSSIADDLAKAGKIDSNYYARPIDDGTTIYSSHTNSSGSKISGLYNLLGWKSLYGFDKASKTSAKQIAPYKITGTIGSNKFPYGSFNSTSDVQKVWANSSTASFDNSGVLDGGYLKVVPTQSSSSIVISVGALSTAKKYILKYSVKGTGTMSISAYLRASTYQPITDLKYWTTTTSRNENEMLFTPTINESSGAVVFTIDAKQTYYLDNIQVYEATAATTNPEDSISFLYNATKSNKTVSLNGNYVDVKNTKYSNSIVLKPYASAVLIKDGGGSTINAAPVVSITSPAILSSYTAPATVTLTAIASDPDGTISKVQFYNGTTLIQTENTAPYDWQWKNVPAGTYTLTAKATDNNGAVTTSSPVTFTVKASSISLNGAPSVSVTSPVMNATYTSPASVRLTASASDADGTISKVEFYNGSTLITTENNAPYDWTWQNVPAGNYTITAKATDNSGNVKTSSGISFTVAATTNLTLNTTSPVVNITSPAVNSTFNGPASVRLTASASDPDGSISKVEFYNGSNLITTEYNAPYDWTWQNVPAGDYSITAKATDNTGKATTSPVVKFKVISNSAPSVSITSPSNNAVYNGPANVKLIALASDADGTISKVEFYNGNTLITTEVNDPYSWTWQNVPAGNYTITARATDNSGNITTSSSVSISVKTTQSLTIAASSNSGGVTDTPALEDIADVNIINNGNLVMKIDSLQSLRVNEGLFDLQDLKLYPNPATTIINLKFNRGFYSNDRAILTIKNSTGGLFKKIPVVLSGNIQVDLSSLSPGLYILSLSNQKFTVSKEFLKLRN